MACYLVGLLFYVTVVLLFCLFVLVHLVVCGLLPCGFDLPGLLLFLCVVLVLLCLVVRWCVAGLLLTVLLLWLLFWFVSCSVCICLFVGFGVWVSSFASFVF